jgi:hypothetical protein
MYCGPKSVQVETDYEWSRINVDFRTHSVCWVGTKVRNQPTTSNRWSRWNLHWQPTNPEVQLIGLRSNRFQLVPTSGVTVRLPTNCVIKFPVWLASVPVDQWSATDGHPFEPIVTAPVPFLPSHPAGVWSELIPDRSSQREKFSDYTLIFFMNTIRCRCWGVIKTYLLDFTNYTTRHKNEDPHLEQCMSGLYLTISALCSGWRYKSQPTLHALDSGYISSRVFVMAGLVSLNYCWVCHLR